MRDPSQSDVRWAKNLDGSLTLFRFELENLRAPAAIAKRARKRDKLVLLKGVVNDYIAISLPIHRDSLAAMDDPYPFLNQQAEIAAIELLEGC